MRVPVTSALAAEEVTRSGKRHTQCLAVFDLVGKYPGRTSLELARLSVDLDRYVVSRRLPELEREGLIRRGPTRDCSVNGRPMLTWEPVRADRPAQMRLIG